MTEKITQKGAMYPVTHLFWHGLAVGIARSTQTVNDTVYTSSLGEKYQGKYAPEIRYQDSILSQIDDGLVSGQGFWTLADWLEYYTNRAAAWSKPRNDFDELVDRLGNLYSNKEDYIRAFSSVFGGIPALISWISAAYASINGPVLPRLNISNDGLNPDYIDTLQPGTNQSHHYVGSFFLGYYIGPEAASAVIFFRDISNSGDINLGWVGAYDGWYYLLSPNYLSISKNIRFRWGN